MRRCANARACILVPLRRRAWHHLIYEIVDNAIDEAIAGYCSEIDVEILEGEQIRVRDNGRGIPVGIQPKMGIPAVTVVFTVLHAGGKFGNGGYKISSGTARCGRLCGCSDCP